jgi:hypothetical protein
MSKLARRMSSPRVVTVALACAIAIAAVAFAGGDALAGRQGQGRPHQVRYLGPHPIIASEGGGFCYIEVPHIHIYDPARPKVLYRMHDGGYDFVGDPVGYGYQGEKHAYYGPHPVVLNVDIHGDVDPDEDEYCYLEGPHFHEYAPPPQAKFTVQGDAYWYVGALPHAYIEARPAMVEINAVYKPLVYERPVVVVETPPPGWVGIEIGVPAPVAVADVEVVGPRAHVVAPAVEAHAVAGFSAGLEVHVPTPSLSVQFGVPGVIVEDHRHTDVVYVDRGHKMKKHERVEIRDHRGGGGGGRRGGGRGRGWAWSR